MGELSRGDRKLVIGFLARERRQLGRKGFKRTVKGFRGDAQVCCLVMVIVPQVRMSRTCRIASYNQVHLLYVSYISIKQ